MPNRPLPSTHRHIIPLALLSLAAALLPPTLVAQPTIAPPLVPLRPPAAHDGVPAPASVRALPHRGPAPDSALLPTAAEWPLLVAVPFASALGAHVLGSPDAWGRTWRGYGNRLGDQVGFLVIEESVRRVLTAVLPPTAPRASCWQAGRSATRNLSIGAGCALASTVAVRPASGDGWRFNAPVTVSLLAATGSSLAWRPERTDAAKARSFLLTRTVIVFGGVAAARLFEDWRHRERADERR